MVAAQQPDPDHVLIRAAICSCYSAACIVPWLDHRQQLVLMRLKLFFCLSVSSIVVVSGVSRCGALYFLYFVVLFSIGTQCEDCTICTYSRICEQMDIRVSSGLCNGQKFSIRACEFHGLGSSKIKQFEAGVSVIATLTTLNCTDEVDRACKEYFAESQVFTLSSCKLDVHYAS